MRIERLRYKIHGAYMASRDWGSTTNMADLRKSISSACRTYPTLILPLEEFDSMSKADATPLKILERMDEMI